MAAGDRLFCVTRSAGRVIATLRSVVVLTGGPFSRPRCFVTAALTPRGGVVYTGTRRGRDGGARAGTLYSRRLGPATQLDPSPPTCLYCNEGIGAFEPLVVVEHDGERETSLVREPELVERQHVLLIHSRCAPAGWRAAS